MVNGIHKKRTLGKSLLLSMGLLLCFATPAYALDVTLQWDANQDTVSGYFIYYRVGSSGGGILANYNGTGAFEGDSPIDVPLALDENLDPDIVEFTVTNLPNGQTYYFVVTAYNNNVVLSESSASNEVSSDATPPPTDTTAPVISNIQATSITDTSAVITWTTDEASDSLVQYGTTSGSYPSNVNSTNMVTNHTVNLTGLSQNTTYYYRVTSEDAATNSRTSSELSFATNSPPDTTAPSIVPYPTINYAADTIDVTFSEAVVTELVTNGNMEVDNHWSNWSFEGTETNTQDSGQNYTGNFSRKLFADGDDDGIISNNFTTTTGEVYTVTFWVYPLDNSTVRCYIRAGDNQSHNGSYWINRLDRLFPNLTLNAWNKISFTYTELGGGSSAYLILSSSPGGGTYYFDDISIKGASGSGTSDNVRIEANYTFSPSLLFDTLGGSDDVAYLGGNTYRLSMSSIPSNTIFTMTVNNVTDAAGNPVTPNSIRINDNDNDGLADDWEASTGVGTWSGDPDSDGLNNLEEFNNLTNPNSSDTDGDTLPDGWEVAYGLDPTDSTGADGRDGDFDGDGWTNYEEYMNGYDPASSTSPAPAAPPEIRKTIPLNNSGITNSKRVPTNTSFAVYLRDVEGIDITDNSSIEFIINDSVNPAYTRNLSHPSVFRVVKLTQDDDDQVKSLWAVYDRSLDTYGDYEYDADVNIKVNAKDRTGIEMAQASFQFHVESSAEQSAARENEPYTSTLMNSPSMGLITESIDSGFLAGAKVIYDSSEPVKPKFGPVNEVPEVGGVGITPAPSSYPINLEPPTVFNNPVTIFIPLPITSDAARPTDDVGTLSVCLFDGENWVVACEANGNVTPAGDGWMVPGSRVNHNNGFPPSIELQVYHFSAVQPAVVVSTATTGSSLSDTSALSGADGGGGGGCFITTVGTAMNGQKIQGLLLTFALAIVCILLRMRRTKGDLMS